MTGIELQRRRVSLELSTDRLAEALGEPRDAVERWEQMPKELPRSLSRRLEWVLANEEHERLMSASEIDECSWVEERLKDLEHLPAKEVAARLREVNEHSRTCAVCQRRQAFAATLPPLPPMPMSRELRLLTTIVQWFQHLP